MIFLKGLEKKQRKIPVNLFFLELIIVLLFFSVSGAIILKIFATADRIEERSSFTERAVIDAQSVAEIYSVSGDMRKAMETIFGKGWFTENSDGSLTVCLDDMRQALINEDVRERYGCISMTVSEERRQGRCGEFCTLTSSLRLLAEDGAEFYRQVSSAYIPDFERKEPV